MTARTVMLCTPAVLCVAFIAAEAGRFRASFERPPAPDPAPGALVTWVVRVPAFLDGFLGRDKPEVMKYCAEPVRAELRVTAADVLLSMATVFVYTPRTLYVTCYSPVHSVRWTTGSWSARSRSRSSEPTWMASGDCTHL